MQKAAGVTAAFYLSHRTSHPDFERVPLGFLTWFLDPSLQRNVIEELMADWVAGTLDDGPFEAYA